MTFPSDAPEPEVSECDVALDQSGGFLFTHRRTRETATAATVADTVIEGIALRVASSWKPRIIPFQTGGLT
ncbi:hypothetical protein [Nonomuraea glycinis]|uniref:hypothetical protein n=1 Tax=Nonomuraea glycinis TaxID=2047744 RepID=UPI002E1550E9|nr:hypothetical protein OHA68_33710 [Nonomuraea glycinis]